MPKSKRRLLRPLITALSLAVAAFFGYQIYLTLRPTPLVTPPSRLRVTQGPLNLDNLANVLGTATSRALNAGTDLLDLATDGQAEPLINQTLQNLQNEIKDLPQEQYEKVKYEFCKDVVKDYEVQE